MHKFSRFLVFLSVVCFASPLWAQEIGDRVVLHSDNPAGVPAHPGDGDNSFVRWPNGTEGEIVDIGNWFEVETATGTSGWVTARYVTPASPDEEPIPANETDAIVVGTWNLEHFKNGATRGFPENTRGGPSYLASERDLGYISSIIRDQIGASILVLNEVNGRPGLDTSAELDALILQLGPSWDYSLSRSGNSQRQAILFDSDDVRREVCHEFAIPEEDVQGKDISARDPLACYFTIIGEGGSEMNDFVVVALHLASGQNNNLNHNRAMEELASRFANIFDGSPFPTTELDILIAGDFNANRYDSRSENFWTEFGDVYDIDTLSPNDGEQYLATRLSGVPLAPRSKIDYVMASGDLREDLVLAEAHIHHEVLVTPFEEFRRLASDHVPVSVRVLVSTDDD